MERQKLREYLDELNSAIEDLNTPDEERAHLANLIVEIEQQLSGPILKTGDPETLSDQVDGMVTIFEQDHPRIASILNNIMVTLSNMGI